MTSGFKKAIYPGTQVSQVDLEATRQEREELHRRLRLRSHLIEVFTSVPPGDERLIVEGEAEPLNETDSGA